MLFQPAIIALLLASGVAVAMLAAAAPFAVQVIRQWDIASGSERQLQLERRTYLFSTLAAFVMAVVTPPERAAGASFTAVQSRWWPAEFSRLPTIWRSGGHFEE